MLHAPQAPLCRCFAWSILLFPSYKPSVMWMCLKVTAEILSDSNALDHAHLSLVTSSVFDGEILPQMRHALMCTSTLSK